MSMKTLIPLIILCCPWPLLVGQTVVYDFNSSGQMSQLTKTGSTGSWESSGGIADSGWVSSGSSGSFLVTNYAATETVLDLSVNFLYQTPTNTGAVRMFALGIKLDDEFSPNLNSARRQVAVEIGYGSSGLRFSSSSVDSSTAVNLSGSLVHNGAFMDPLVDGQWYKMNATFSLNESNNQITLTGSLYNADPNTGEILGSALGTYSRTWTNVSIVQSDGLLTFVGSSTDLLARGIAGIDNFTTVIPEVESMAWLVGLGLIGGIGTLRRLHRRKGDQ